MSNLFKKAIAFTDIHFGNKSNSITHNEDCVNFVKWVIEKAKEENCETCLFLGDWHHHRASINVATLNHSVEALTLLSSNFDQIIFIPGNHDEYYRDRRDFNSVTWARHIPNVRIFNDITVEGDVAIVPWLVGEEYKKIRKIEAKYMLGHFELPNFYMNAMVQMPDHGEIKHTDFQGVERMFTGHFHKRQEVGNITYIGNAFPHNYSDAWDDDRGAMILEWGQPHRYIKWDQAPKYKVLKLSKLLDNPKGLLLPKSYIRVNLDIDISYEEANFIKETFYEQYDVREIALIPQKEVDTNYDNSAEINFESVDSIVISQLDSVQSDLYDPKLLMEIYRNL